MLRCRFQHCLGTFTIFLVDASSKLGLFRHLSDYIFGVPNFENTKPMRVILLFKMFKIETTFQKCNKKFRKGFFLWDDCIWTGIFKLSLSITRYFPSAANVLTSSPKILHVNKRDFFQLNFLGSDRWMWERCCDADFNSVWARLSCCLSKCPLKWDFLDII